MTIERKDDQLKAVIMGENRGVMSTYRLINAINKAIKGDKIEGKLSDEVEIKKLVRSHFEGNDSLLIDVTQGKEDKQEVVYVSYLNVLNHAKVEAFLESLKAQIVGKKSLNSKKSKKSKDKKPSPPPQNEPFECPNQQELSSSSSDSD